MSLWRCRWWTTGAKRTGSFFFFLLFFIFKTKSSANERERERDGSARQARRGPSSGKKKNSGNSLCAPPHVDVCRVFVDARELGKSRVRTNHSVAGIHYYRREYVPKSTLRSPPSLSPAPFLLQVKVVEHFFFFFFSKLEKLGHILWSLHHRSRAEKSDKDISGMESYSGKDLFPYVALAQGKRSTQIVAIPDHSLVGLSHRLCRGCKARKSLDLRVGPFWVHLKKSLPAATKPVNGSHLITPDSGLKHSQQRLIVFQIYIWPEHVRLRQRNEPPSVTNEAWQSESQDKRNVSLMWK